MLGRYSPKLNLPGILLLIGGASKPFITLVESTKDFSLLQCVVRGASPKPEVGWKDSAGNTLPAEEPQVSERRGSCDVTVNINVTKTGSYRCVATQEELGHQTFADTKVFISVNPSSVSVKPCEDCSTKVAVGWLGGIIIGAVVVAAVLAGLKAKNCITFACNRGAAKDPTSSSNDPTNDSLLLQVGVKGEHQHQNGAAKDPTSSSNDPTNNIPLLEVGVTGEHQHLNGAAKDPTSSSTDPTNNIPLLQVGVKGEHQHLNGFSKAPAETSPV